MIGLLSALRKFDVGAFRRTLHYRYTISDNFLPELKNLIEKDDLVHHIVLAHQNSYDLLRTLFDYIPKDDLISLIDNEDSFCITPLESACSVGNWPCATLLIEKGANVNHHHIENLEVMCPLGNTLGLMSVLHYHDIAEKNIIKLLLEKGADLNDKQYENSGPRQLSPLWAAVKTESTWIVEMLLDYGARISVNRNRYGGEMMWNILEYSIARGEDYNIEKLLITRCSIEERKKLIDVITLVSAIKTITEKKVEIVLAYFIEYCRNIGLGSCGYIISKILQYGSKDNRFLREFLILFPNAKNCMVKKKFEREYTPIEYAKRFTYNLEAVDIIQNFELTLFDLLTLHLYYREIRELKNYTS
jgi:ankyrin repeat protein